MLRVKMFKGFNFFSRLKKIHLPICLICCIWVLNITCCSFMDIWTLLCDLQPDILKIRAMWELLFSVQPATLIIESNAFSFHANKHFVGVQWVSLIWDHLSSEIFLADSDLNLKPASSL